MVSKYIMDNWKNCIRENKKSCGTEIGLPYPYTVPCVSESFQEMYYWDTYFTNVGLLLSNLGEQAKNNVDNMLYLVNKYGFMPNGNRTYYLSRSQPPFLSMMVRDIFDSFNDIEWLKKAYSGLLIEYDFWSSERNTECDLNQYGGDMKKIDIDEYADGFLTRTKMNIKADKFKLAQNFVIHCESGWDINPRWGVEAESYVQVDLNSLLYVFEKNMEYFSEKLSDGMSAVWEKRAEERKEKIRTLLLSDSGLYFDYNFKNKSLSSVYSVAGFYPMLCGLANTEDAHAAMEKLADLETEYGIVTCEKNGVSSNCQWDYPNGWAPLHYVVVKGLLNYGYDEDAKRIATKYVKLVDRVFKETHNLWEKYNVVEGNINVSNEYEMPAMMGWSAGVYLFCRNVSES